MDRRYILLTSAYRNRTQYPNPFKFSVSYISTKDKLEAYDWVSENAPIINFDLENYFSSTDGITAPYRWIITGSIDAPNTNSVTDTFVVNLVPTLNGSAVITGQYVGLTFSSTSNSSDEIITAFVDNLDGTFTVTLSNNVSFTEGGADTFTIKTPPLALNQTYVPNPVSNVISLDNAYTGLFLNETDETISSKITDFDKTTRILTANDDFILSAIARPNLFSVTNNSKLVTYNVQTIDSTTNDITILQSEHNGYTSEILIGQYIYHYASGTTAQIISSSTVAGIITLNIMSTANITAISASDIIGIVFFEMDNFFPFNYQHGMRGQQQHNRCEERIYDLELLSLQIPNKLIKGHPGGYPVNYPHFIVELRNLSSTPRTDQIIYSNNPHLNRANFICPVWDISSPSFSSFTKMDGNGILYPFIIKTNDTLEFSIKTPNGNIVTLEESDTMSPVTPNEMLQVSALFAVTARLSK